MEVAAIKTEIQKLVETQSDPAILQRVYEILEQAQQEAAWKDVMNAGALRAEEDIKAGRIYSMEEFRSMITDYIKQKR
ncbi:hypothetical protein [Ohtaekwangia sp.]|uniref:hypothetical protein n=1 Tax=Ohtaekwangia sp. TaxID=2066019 RepID=UPI002F92B465